MEWWIDFAKGPLFAFTFLIMIIGLLRHVIIQIYYLFIAKGTRLKNVPWKKIFSDIATWIFPVGHLIKGTIIFSIVSFIFHVGLIIVSVFLIDHIVLWEGLSGLNLPAIGRNLADYLTLITIASIIILLGCRIFIKRIRVTSTKRDYIILVMVLLPFVFGYLAGHPNVNPFTWEFAMLMHLLTAEALFIVIPFTKLAHIVLYFFDRISPVHWQLKPGAGDKVAEALFGKEAKV
jgi:nitrate reductase gamma subunit